MLPIEASATINFRLLPGDSLAAVQRRVRKIIDDPLVQVRPLAAGQEASPLSRTDNARRISYRDLTVRELGSIYERLLEWEAKADAVAPGRIEVRLNPFGRKGSGSYYTPDELVTLIIEQTIDPLIDERIDAFRQQLTKLGEIYRWRLELKLHPVQTDSSVVALTMYNMPREMNDIICPGDVLAVSVY